MPGERFDYTDDPHPGSKNAAGAEPRPFVGILFECCRVYARVYRNAAETAYEGFCPRCAHRVVLKIGPGGSDQRFFRAQ